MHAAQKPGTITSMSIGIAQTWIKSHGDLLVLWLSWVPETLKKVLFSGTQGSRVSTKKSQATTQRSFAKSMFDLQHDNSDSVSPAERLATCLMTTRLPRLELISQGNTCLVAGPIKPFSHFYSTLKRMRLWADRCCSAPLWTLCLNFNLYRHAKVRHSTPTTSKKRFSSSKLGKNQDKHFQLQTKRNDMLPTP